MEVLWGGDAVVPFLPPGVNSAHSDMGGKFVIFNILRYLNSNIFTILQAHDTHHLGTHCETR